MNKNNKDQMETRKSNDSMKLTVAFFAATNFDPYDLGSVYSCFAAFPDDFKLFIVAPPSDMKGNIVESYHFYGVEALASSPNDEFDILIIVAQDMGNYTSEIHNYLANLNTKTKFTLTVCMGSAYFSQVGALDNLEATITKVAFELGHAYRKEVKWIPNKRWVQSGKYWTSSGASAGMDMAAAFISYILGDKSISTLESTLGICLSRDSQDDPFKVDKLNYLKGYIGKRLRHQVMPLSRHFQSCHRSPLNAFFGKQSKGWGVRRSVGILAFDGMDLNSFVTIHHLLAMTLTEFKVVAFNPINYLVKTRQGLTIHVGEHLEPYDYVFVPDGIQEKNKVSDLLKYAQVLEALYHPPLTSLLNSYEHTNELKQGFKGNILMLRDFYNQHVGMNSLNNHLDTAEIMPMNRESN